MQSFPSLALTQLVLGKCQSTHPEISISFNSTNTAAAAGNGDDDGQDDLNNDLDDDGQ